MDMSDIMTDCSDNIENDSSRDIQIKIQKAIEEGILNDKKERRRFFKQLATRKKKKKDDYDENYYFTSIKNKYFKKEKTKDNLKDSFNKDFNNIYTSENYEYNIKHEIVNNVKAENENENEINENIKNEKEKDNVDNINVDNKKIKREKNMTKKKSEKNKMKDKKNLKKRKSIKCDENDKNNENDENNKNKKNKNGTKKIEEENLKINKVQLFFESETDSFSTSSNDIEILNDLHTSKSNFNFLTWNIDGLCDILVKTRMLKVIEIIKKKDISIVFLQEVINDTKDLIYIYLSDLYYIIEPEDTCGKKLSYYCLTLIKKNVFKLIYKQTIWFYGTVMGRHAIKILIESIDFPNQNILLINTHLESTIRFKEERICQLKECFINILNEKNINTVIFGGDLNCRDDEIKSIKLPSNILDIYEYLGHPKNLQYTWNCLINNHFSNCFFKANARFDRIYWVQNNLNDYIKPVNIKKIGQKRLSKHHHVRLSDHVGLIIKFNIIKK